MADRSAAGQPRLTLVLGGARSGKSRHAQVLAMASPPPWIYVATAEPGDDEMAARIAEHRAARGKGWFTIEAPVDLAKAVSKADGKAPLVVDCLTLWLSNLMLGEHDVEAALARFTKALSARKGPAILVSNEVGGGIVPDSPLARDFRDKAGLINQHFALNAQQVVYMVAGLPMKLKPLP
jgi:adenosyl cobinamide kinase/adenosyl cobinamide phosphate guanylyltransferase